MDFFYAIIFLFAYSIVDIFAYVDPSITNPQLIKRFEYKLSFKGPHLAFSDGTVPFWKFGGNTIAGEEQVRITPSIRSQRGHIWSTHGLAAENWVIDVKIRIIGRGRVGADGMAIWITEQPGVDGNVFGSNDHWKGLGVFLDSFDNDALQNNPIIAVMLNDGTKSYEHQNDGVNQIQGSCIRDFRNKPFPIRLKIEHINHVLTIYINNGISQDENAFEFCTRIENVQLPKVGYMGVTAATGALADDHDVLEFLTHTYIPKPLAPEIQPSAEDQARKYREEYEQYEQRLREQQAEFQKSHPEVTTPINEQQLYETEYDREFRVILEGQENMRTLLANIDKNMLELSGRVERLATVGSAPQITGQAQGAVGSTSNVPADVARIQDINRVINANTDMSRTIQSFAQVLTDLQQKVTNLQANINQQQPNNFKPQAVNANLDLAVLNELRETVRQIKSETNTLVQKTPSPVKCPTVVGSGDTTCLGTYTFFGIIALQIVILIGYFTFKGRKEHLSRKYL